MDLKETVKISKFLSLVLRHKPETIGLKLDEQGWADVNELLQKINKGKFFLTFDNLEYIVNTNNKKRFKLSDDHRKIRASQGHSIDVNLGLIPAVPLGILYHGTGDQFVKSIIRNGLTKQSRQHVHLSPDVETAIKVGKRHGSVTVFEVNAAEMAEKDFLFFCSDNGVWLTDHVPAKYLKPVPLIKPVIQKKPYKPDCGDILSGGEYIVRKVKGSEEVGSFLSSQGLSETPWVSIRKMGVDTEPLEKAFKYTCPYTGNTYYHFIPLAILLETSKDVTPYKKYPYDTGWSFAFDLEWNKERCKIFDDFTMSRVTESMLGHGYTDGTLPSDGSGNFIYVLIELSNGDFLFGYCYEWYNK